MGGLIDGGGSTDDGGSSTSSSSDDGGLLPGWVKSLKVLVPVATTLVAFASSPRRFILEHVLTFFVGLFLEAGAIVAGAFESVWLLVGEALVNAFDPVFRAGGLIAATVSGVLSTINGALLAVVSAAGPAAPIVAMFAWVLFAIVVTLLVRWALKLLPYVGQWI